MPSLGKRSQRSDSGQAYLNVRFDPITIKPENTIRPRIAYSVIVDGYIMNVGYRDMGEPTNNVISVQAQRVALR